MTKYPTPFRKTDFHTSLRLKPKQPESHEVPECKVCDDTGWVYTRNDKGYTVATYCPACDRINKQREEQLFKAAKIPQLPDNYKPSEDIVKYVNELRNCKDRDNWILFTGRPGTGKTTAAAWIATQVIKKHKQPVRFYSTFNLVTNITMCRTVSDRTKMVGEATEAPFVVFDDFLKTFPKPESYQYHNYFEAVVELFWFRYENHMPTCITTQASLEDIINFDVAFASRLVDRCDGRIISFGDEATNWRINR